MGLFGRGGGLFGGGLFGGNNGFLGGNNGFFGGSSGGSTGGIINNPIEINKEIVKQSDTLIGEMARTLDDAKEEFHELCTDGFVEMVIKGNKNYKTSFEIKDEADEKIRAARRKYQEKCYEFNKFLEALNEKINDLYEKKVELARRINQNVGSMPNMPKISTYISSPDYSYKPSTISMICDFSGLNKVSDIKGRKDSANEYLEDAKDFEVEICGKIAEINRVKAFLDTVKMNLDEEETLLAALNDSINTGKNLEYDKIVKQLRILISEYILDSGGKKNEKYLEAINQLSKIS